MVVPQFTATPMGAVPKLRSFTVSGIFELGMQEYDANLALISMQDAERLNGFDGPTGIRLKLDDMREAFPVAQELVNKLQWIFGIEWPAPRGHFEQRGSQRIQIGSLVHRTSGATTLFRRHVAEGADHLGIAPNRCRPIREIGQVEVNERRLIVG